jgi:hypothetical protein
MLHPLCEFQTDFSALVDDAQRPRLLVLLTGE